MSEIRLHVDKTALFLSFPPAFFLSWCQSVKWTRRQAEISLKPISFLFKEVWVLDWEARPHWKRSLRVFIKLAISVLTCVTTADHEKRPSTLPSFIFMVEQWNIAFIKNDTTPSQLHDKTTLHTFGLSWSIARGQKKKTLANRDEGRQSEKWSTLWSLTAADLLLTAALRLNLRNSTEGRRKGGKDREISYGTGQH